MVVPPQAIRCMPLRMGRVAGIVIYASLIVFLCGPARAGENDRVPPTYASLRSDKAYLREGPSYAHRILWIYRRRGYPLVVIGRYDIWAHVRDMDGTSGWMSSSVLSDARTIVVTGKANVPIRADAGLASPPVAFAAPGVVARLKACKVFACRISAEGIDGWIDKTKIWGVGAGEIFD
jgi:SH3-like domain-containing protein